jgi:hypothetical protein
MNYVLPPIYEGIASRKWFLVSSLKLGKNLCLFVVDFRYNFLEVSNGLNPIG